MLSDEQILSIWGQERNEYYGVAHGDVLDFARCCIAAHVTNKNGALAVIKVKLDAIDKQTDGIRGMLKSLRSEIDAEAGNE